MRKHVKNVLPVSLLWKPGKMLTIALERPAALVNIWVIIYKIFLANVEPVNRNYSI